jgi:hypothetical protein
MLFGGLTVQFVHICLPSKHQSIKATWRALPVE